MKKYLYLIPVAALAMTACTNESDEFVGSQESREISFMPVNQMATRAAVDGTVFPTDKSMQVAAYDATNSRDFFTTTEFSYSGASTIWTGGKYWPLSAATINFLAYSEFEGSSATWNLAGSGKAASGVTLVMTNNSSAQKDLMYAIGTGTVSQSGNVLTFPTNVPMVFKHAQAWISFYADAYDATSGGKVTLNSITLNGAKYNGTYTITHTNYDKTKAERDEDASKNGSVSGAWTLLGDAANVVVPGWSTAAIAYDDSGDGVVVGNGLLIVPDDDAETNDFTSFTINYSLDGNEYNYTYTPASRNVDQAKHYIYNINFHLHEIEISATVTDWVDQTPVAVPIY